MKTLSSALGQVPGGRIAAILLAIATTARAGEGVVYFCDFDGGQSEWRPAAQTAAKAEWAPDSGFDGSGGILMEVGARRASASWRSPAILLNKGRFYGLAIRSRARREHQDTGMFRLDFEGASSTPDQIDEMKGIVNAPGMDMRFPDLGFWRVKRFWFTPALDETTIVLRTQGRYDDQTMWYDDLAIVDAAALAMPIAPADGAISPTRSPTLTWRPPFGTAPPASYTVVIARDESLTESRREFFIDGFSAAPPEPLSDGTWFWSVFPTVSNEVDEPIVQLASEVRSIYVRPASSFESTDTTPPHIFRPNPLPDSTVESGHRWLSFRIIDKGGSGVDSESLSILIDGVSYEKTKPKLRIIESDIVRIGWSADADTADPPRWQPLADGIRRVDVAVSDRAGNRAAKTWQFGVNARIPPKTWIDIDGRTFCNGLEFFPVALYLKGKYRRDPWEWVDHGANTIVNAHTFQSSYGAKSLPGVMWEFRDNKDIDEMREKLAKLTGKLKESNSVLGYWLNETHDSLTAEGFRVLDELDSDHFALYSEGWGFANYGHTSDGYFYNDYAVPVRPLTSQMVRQESAREARKPNQTIWYINQGYDHATYPRGPKRGTHIEGLDWRPNGREMRAMAHLAMIGGDMGICWWAPWIDMPEAKEAYRRLLDQMREFTWVGPSYWADHPKQKTTATWEGGPRRFIMNRREKLYFTERITEEARYLMAVNVDTAPLVATFDVPGLEVGHSVQVMFEDRRLTASGPEFSDVFPGPGAHVYRIAR
jgi:hypothetical protein